MKFGEKVRLLRNEKRLSQTELGQLCGLSLRTIRNYEVSGRYPKRRIIYTKLADTLGCNVNYLLSEDENLTLQAKETCRYSSTPQVEALIAGISALFESGDMCDAEKDAVMRTVQEAYWIGKEKNQGKYMSEKYRRIEITKE